MTRTKLFVLIVMLSSSVFTYAQEENDKLSLEKGTVENQFNFILEKSSKYEDYKVVKEGWLYVLKSHVMDSVKSLKKGLRESHKTINVKQAEIDSIKQELAGIGEQLTTSLNEKNSLRFLGILMGKSSYNSLMWTILLSLAALLAVFIMLFKRSQSVTNQTKTDLQELKDEFETFRKRALDREEKLSRKYLDDLNKIKSRQD
jgi:hypothetical protein